MISSLIKFLLKAFLIQKNLLKNFYESQNRILGVTKVVILGLHKLRSLGVTTCIVKTDSKIVAGQIEKDFSTKELVLMQYLLVVRSLEKQSKGFTLQHIERNKNEEADMLTKAAAKGDPLPSDVFSTQSAHQL
jgi:ribonuclease HI